MGCARRFKFVAWDCGSAARVVNNANVSLSGVTRAAAWSCFALFVNGETVLSFDNRGSRVAML